MNHKDFGVIIGTFSKGVKGSCTVNFTISGGKHCSDTCPLKGTVCYAELTQKMKPSIHKNLTKKENNFSGFLRSLTTEKALAKLANAPWVRFAAFGSIPAPSTWTLQDKMALRLIADAVSSHGRYHFPIETVEKAQALHKLGFKNVRVSIGEAIEASVKGFPVSVSFDCGKRCIGKNKRTIAKPAFEYAKALRTVGINAKVCPAISGSAKCGDCTMCANNDIKMIVYPVH